MRLRREEVPSFDEYPFSLPAVRELFELSLPYEETEHYTVTRDFLNHHERMLRELMADEDA